MYDVSKKRPSEAPFTLQAIDGIRRGLGLALTHLYMLWMSLSIPLRTALKTFSSLTLLLAAGTFLFEAVVTIVRVLGADVELNVIQLPIWVEVVILVLAGLMVRHRVHELKALRRKPALLRSVKFLLRQVASLNFNSLSDAEKRALLHKFITQVLIGSRGVFEEIGKVQINVMLPDPGGGPLRIRYKLPTNARYKANLSFSRGEGAAGHAFATGKIVYIPSIRFRHGIVFTMPDRAKRRRKIIYHLKDSIYKETNPEPYQAILCVPIKSSADRVLGVLNLDVRRTNPFTEFDFQAAEVTATFLAMALEPILTDG